MIHLIFIFLLLQMSPVFAGNNYQVAIEQNMIFFCMKNRKKPQFLKSEFCKSYAHKTLYRCQRVSKKSSYKTLRCLKKSLRI
ncbi:MAG: hypothetical protein DRQ88_00330 [Epsilonproteobacteria bacterium]|nr:MAG: hypothetical protein DRQ89_06255 [Campylobacterota bacterium]RLA68082.1 MAG: hypothetical protein DRQ88_00330 [Campylobacterota bacterium]